MNIKNTLIIFSLIFISTLKAQETEKVNQIQPSLMVVPFTKGGENALELYENDFKWQAIISRINNAFQERGFRPKDLQETINQVKRSKAISSLKDAKFNIEEELYMQARPDIIVRAFINIHSDDGGSTNSVQIALKAIETSSRMALYDLPTAVSPAFKTSDYGYLADRILTEENRIEKFVDGINEAFGQTIEMGKAISVEILVTEESQCKLDDEVDGGDFISEQITDWVKDNAYKNQYRIKQDSENLLSFDEVRIPLRNDNGTNYTVNDFARSISRALTKICRKKEGVTVKRKRPSVSEGTIRIVLP